MLGYCVASILVTGLASAAGIGSAGVLAGSVSWWAGAEASSDDVDVVNSVYVTECGVGWVSDGMVL